MEERQVDKLARLIIYMILFALGLVVLKSISSVLVYVIGAAVISLIGRPLKRLICKIHIKKWYVPDWLGALIALLIIIGSLIGIMMLMVPIFTHIAFDISRANMDRGPISLSKPLNNFNEYIRHNFAFLGADFKIQDFIKDKLSSVLNVSMLSGVVSGLAGVLSSFGVGIFAIMFIAFFFLKDITLFPAIVSAIVPSRIEKRFRESLTEMGALVSRYFAGITLEVLGVAFLNFLGLLIIGKMGFRYSLGIAFMTGLLNIIPYVGPLVGEVLGVTLAVVIKYACAGNFGPDVTIGVFIVLIAVLLYATQMVDNFVFQPLIYSNSIKAHPLEVFIVLLIAGHFGGMMGMFIAVPAYSVIRVIAAKFFMNVKAVRRLIGEQPQEQK